MVPVTDKLNPGDPANALLGASEVIVGGAPMMVKLLAATPVGPPPGLGFITSTITPPSVFTRFAGTVAIKLVAVTVVAGSTWPLKMMEAPLTNPVPVALRGMATYAVPLVGLIEESVGGVPRTTNVSG